MIWPGRGGALGAGFAGIAMVRCGIAGEGGGVEGAGGAGGGAGVSRGAGVAAIGPASGGRKGVAGRGVGTAGVNPAFSGSGSAAGGAAASGAAAGGAAAGAAEAAGSTDAGTRRIASGSSFIGVPAFVSSSIAGAMTIPKSCSLPGDSPFSSPSKCRTLRATSSSIELEWVFFSDTPSSGRRSMILCGLTSNSRASSLIRILLIC